MTGKQLLREQEEPAPSLRAATEQAPSAGKPGEHKEGGEPACWAHLVCAECGAMISEGHRTGCHAGRGPAVPAAP
jgi:hypothetical protein